jgi:hypothetical protein
MEYFNSWYTERRDARLQVPTTEAVAFARRCIAEQITGHGFIDVRDRYEALYRYGAVLAKIRSADFRDVRPTMLERTEAEALFLGWIADEAAKRFDG